MMAEIKHLQTWNTGIYADSVEWCPIEKFQHLFVCGTYQLAKQSEDLTSNDSPETQSRFGQILLFEVKGDPQTLKLKQTLETHGVLDQKWCKHTLAGNPVLGVVDSKGYLKLYKLVQGESDDLSLQVTTEFKVTDCLALSLDWSTGKYPTNEPSIVVSDSKGSVSTYILRENGLEQTNLNMAHQFEAWICAFNYWNPDFYFSGGDDCKLHVFDMRMKSNTPTLSNTKSHEAGVTSFHSNKFVEDGLISGSYDEKIRKWDLRKFKNPVVEVSANGGVWRLKWHPKREDLLLAACMYGSFQILKHNGNEFNIIAEHNEHKSIAYGADWSYMNNCHEEVGSRRSSFLFSTCSFYDSKLDVNEITLSN